MLITTGTGSSKTESFLIPVLDHCRRERQLGQAGIKAILLYPMNALATDQTARIDEMLADPALRGITAGLYIGDVAEIEYPHVFTKRSEMRRTPPDILVTNYKMLELLLQRADDVGDGLLPRQLISRYRDTDPKRYQRERQRDRSLLFVATTRPRDELAVFWHGTPAPCRKAPASYHLPFHPLLVHCAPAADKGSA